MAGLVGRAGEFGRSLLRGCNGTGSDSSAGSAGSEALSLKGLGRWSAPTTQPVPASADPYSYAHESAPTLEELCEPWGETRTIDEIWDEYKRTGKMPYNRTEWKMLAEDLGLGE